jgi:hypothetical protein
MPRTILTGGWILPVLCLSLPAIVHADPLPSATWTETMSIHAATVTKEYGGQDAIAPEALSGTLSASQYSLEGDVTFGHSGPPFAIAHAKGSLTNGGGDLLHPLSYGVISESVITFDLMIVPTHVPPVQVENVPFVITSVGSLFATGQCTFCVSAGTASGSMVVYENDVEVFNKTVSITSNDGQASMAAADGISLHPGSILHCSLTVLAQMGVAFSGSGESTASLGPGFEISSAFIPGTEYQYRDFFQIEYSPGYWALGNPTPVNPTTWGRIKSLYSMH